MYWGSWQGSSAYCSVIDFSGGHAWGHNMCTFNCLPTAWLQKYWVSEWLHGENPGLVILGWHMHLWTGWRNWVASCGRNWLMRNSVRGNESDTWLEFCMASLIWETQEYAYVSIESKMEEEEGRSWNHSPSSLLHCFIIILRHVLIGFTDTTSFS